MFVESCCLTYCRISDQMLGNQSTSVAEIFILFEYLWNVELFQIRIALRNPLRSGKNFISLFATRSKNNYSQCSRREELCLAKVVKSMNATFRLERLVLSALVFGESPQIQASRIRSLSKPYLLQVMKQLTKNRKRCQVRCIGWDLSVYHNINLQIRPNQFTNLKNSF